MQVNIKRLQLPDKSMPSIQLSLFGKMKPFMVWCFILLIMVKDTTCTFSKQRFEEFQAKLEQFVSYNPTNATWPCSLVPNTKKNGRVIYPIGYGADPFGVLDSSDAILNALHDAYKLRNERHLLPGVHDLGGIVIDLQGGSYKISKPLRFPSGGGNIVIKKGSLRASNSFPGDRHLIELVSPESKVPGNNVYYEDITFRDILFDSSFRGGGILLVDAVRIRINNCFFLHFTTQGILVKKGHETLISSSFLGQHSTVGGHKQEKHFSGTAVELASNDNAVTEVVIFSAAIGVVLIGEANMVTGIHCYNKANVFGGVGILVKSGASLTRISNCYLDYTSIVMEDPIQVHVTNGLFIGNANIILRSIKGKISGLKIVDNMFKGLPENMVPIVELDGSFTAIDQVVIDHNNVRHMVLKSTVGKLSVAGNGTRWSADFSSLLVFPNRISHFQYSFYVQGEPVRNVVHSVTDLSNNVMVVESDAVVSGVVSVMVDQYNMVAEVFVNV